jgi:hypothetical protein
MAKGSKMRADWGIPAGDDPSWRSEGWAPAFDAASCADFIADVVLAHHRDSIIAGRHPANGAPAKPLDPEGSRGRKAKQGKRPNVRGNTGRKAGLPMKLRRAKIKVEGVTRASGPQRRGQSAPTAGVPSRARVTIKPSAKTRGYVQREANAGVAEFFSADGETLRRVEAALEVWVAKAIVGELPEGNPGERDADQVKKS